MPLPTFGELPHGALFVMGYNTQPLHYWTKIGYTTALSWTGRVVTFRVKEGTIPLEHYDQVTREGRNPFHTNKELPRDRQKA